MQCGSHERLVSLPTGGARRIADRCRADHHRARLRPAENALCQVHETHTSVHSRRRWQSRFAGADDALARTVVAVLDRLFARVFVAINRSSYFYPRVRVLRHFAMRVAQSILLSRAVGDAIDSRNTFSLPTSWILIEDNNC